MFMSRKYILIAYILEAQGETCAHEKSGPIGPLFVLVHAAAAAADVA